MAYKDKEKQKAYQQEYRKKHPNTSKKYYTENPYKSLLHNAKNRAKKI